MSQPPAGTSRGRAAAAAAAAPLGGAALDDLKEHLHRRPAAALCRPSWERHDYLKRLRELLRAALAEGAERVQLRLPATAAVGATVAAAAPTSAAGGTTLLCTVDLVTTGPALGVVGLLGRYPTPEGSREPLTRCLGELLLGLKRGGLKNALEIGAFAERIAAHLGRRPEFTCFPSDRRLLRGTTPEAFLGALRAARAAPRAPVELRWKHVCAQLPAAPRGAGAGAGRRAPAAKARGRAAAGGRGRGRVRDTASEEEDDEEEDEGQQPTGNSGDVAAGGSGTATDQQRRGGRSGAKQGGSGGGEASAGGGAPAVAGPLPVALLSCSVGDVEIVLRLANADVMAAAAAAEAVDAAICAAPQPPFGTVDTIVLGFDPLLRHLEAACARAQRLNPVDGLPPADLWRAAKLIRRRLSGGDRAAARQLLQLVVGECQRRRQPTGPQARQAALASLEPGSWLAPLAMMDCAALLVTAGHTVVLPADLYTPLSRLADRRAALRAAAEAGGRLRAALGAEASGGVDATAVQQGVAEVATLADLAEEIPMLAWHAAAAAPQGPRVGQLAEEVVAYCQAGRIPELRGATDRLADACKAESEACHDALCGIVERALGDPAAALRRSVLLLPLNESAPGGSATAPLGPAHWSVLAVVSPSRLLDGGAPGGPPCTVLHLDSLPPGPRATNAVRPRLAALLEALAAAGGCADPAAAARARARIAAPAARPHAAPADCGVHALALMRLTAEAAATAEGQAALHSLTDGVPVFPEEAYPDMARVRALLRLQLSQHYSAAAASDAAAAAAAAAAAVAAPPPQFAAPRFGVGGDGGDDAAAARDTGRGAGEEEAAVEAVASSKMRGGGGTTKRSRNH